MNKDKLFDQIQSELEQIEKDTLMLKSKSSKENESSAERLASKVSALLYLVECRDLSPSAVKDGNYSEATKKRILGFYDPQELIEEILKK